MKIYYTSCNFVEGNTSVSIHITKASKKTNYFYRRIPFFKDNMVISYYTP